MAFAPWRLSNKAAGCLWGRELAVYTDRYPELEVLGSLPVGTVLDGEVVILCDGRADFNAILRRHQLVSLPQDQPCQPAIPCELRCV